MKLKLDENLGSVAFEHLQKAGHDVSSVRMQALCGTGDRDLIKICAAEGRCLVTLDLDFSNPLQFPPRDYAGIIVLRLPKQPSATDILECLGTLTTGVPLDAPAAGTLRVVSKGRIREYGGE